MASVFSSSVAGTQLIMGWSVSHSECYRFITILYLTKKNLKNRLPPVKNSWIRPWLLLGSRFVDFLSRFGACRLYPAIVRKNVIILGYLSPIYTLALCRLWLYIFVLPFVRLCFDLSIFEFAVIFNRMKSRCILNCRFVTCRGSRFVLWLRMKSIARTHCILRLLLSSWFDGNCLIF